MPSHRGHDAESGTRRDHHGTLPHELRPVAEHVRKVAGLIPRADVIELPLQEALGRVLAADITSPVSLPPFDNSAMDGYAVRRADIATVPFTLPVIRDIPAGAPDVGPLEPGTAVRIMTGAPMPPGADFVIPVEFTDGGTKAVTVTEAPDLTHPQVRPAGDDVISGATVLTAGTTVGPAHIGVASAVGHARLPVYRPLTVLVLSTGSELAAPGSPLGPGQIYESNGRMLAAAVTEAGAEARIAHFVADDVAVFRAALAEHAAGCDLILTSGGVSAGAYEVVKDAFTGAGVEFVKVAMQPGMPQGCGIYDAIPVVTLPGNPVSAFVSFEVFVRPAIRASMGFGDPHRPVVRLPLAAPLDSPPHKRQFRRGILDAVRGTVELVGGPGSHLLASLAQADCFAVVPEDVIHMEAGEEVEVWLLS